MLRITNKIFKYLTSLLNSGKYYFFTDLIDRIISFIIFLFFAKSLPTTIYGQIVTVFAITSIIATICDFGLPIFIQRESARNNKLNDVFNQIAILKLILLGAYVLLSFIVFLFFVTAISWTVVILIIWITFFMNVGNSLKYFYYGKDNSRQVFFFSVSAKAILLSFVAFAYLFNTNFIFFLLGYLIANIYLSVSLLLKLNVYSVHISNVLDGLSSLKIVFNSILHLGFASIFNMLYDRVDIVILSILLNFDKVAQYNVAYTIFKISIIALSIFIYPALNKFTREENSEDKLLASLKRLSIIIIVFSLVLILVYYFVISRLIVIFFGIKYVEAGNLISYLAIAIVFLGLNNLTGVFLNAVGRFKATMIATLFGLFINISSNIILIPKVNSLGAVYATILTEVSILAIEMIFIYNFFNKKMKVAL